MKKSTAFLILSILIGMANAQLTSKSSMGMDSTSLAPMVSPYNTIFTTAHTYTASTYTATPINGVCGADNGSTVYVTPTALCSTGTATSVSVSGSTYSWACSGLSGGSASSCSASKPLASCAAKSTPSSIPDSSHGLTGMLSGYSIINCFGAAPLASSGASMYAAFGCQVQKMTSGPTLTNYLYATSTCSNGTWTETW